MKYGKFLVYHSVDGFLTYIVPERYFSFLNQGQLFLVPVQKRSCVALFWEECEKPTFKCKEVENTLNLIPCFSKISLKWLSWISDYYLTPLSRCLNTLGPGLVWDRKRLTAVENRVQKKGWESFLAFKPLHGESQETQKRGDILLNPSQEEVFLKIISSSKPVLLHGVTGSGKTEVYLKLTLKVLEEGKTAIILVPEISLTPQMTRRFREVFQENLMILHSMLTPLEYEREWFRVAYGKGKVVLGVRTSIFAPLQNVGLIIVDEEHDTSYKTDEMPTYHARDIAVLRASFENALCVLGSATPSLESWENAKRGKYEKVDLFQKFATAKIETIQYLAKEYIDYKSRGNKGLKSSSLEFQSDILCEPILKHIQETVEEKKQQVMILLNRRGYCSYGLCSQCGEALLCPRCSVSTTLHFKNTVEICHQCGFQAPIRKRCPTCQSLNTIIPMGAGTQKLEEQLLEKFPQFQVSRLDRDIMTSQSRFAQVLEDFRLHKTDILIGTQLLSKGHDFSHLGLVVITHVEDGLFLPDFRASERTFQLLVQTTGRVGRAGQQGKLVIQSLLKNHPVVEEGILAHVENFLNREAKLRKLGGYPPFRRQILMEFQSKNKEEILQVAHLFKEDVFQTLKKLKFLPQEASLVGPFPALIEKVNQVYRFHLALFVSKNISHKDILAQTILKFREQKWKITINVDPYSMF